MEKGLSVSKSRDPRRPWVKCRKQFSFFYASPERAATTLVSSRCFELFLYSINSASFDNGSLTDIEQHAT